ncbi:MAG: S-layer homology domain-containing protein [Clostridia bacterium]|nr:S-layer homology domain-containing protein [Clostridia bacterium]
MKRLICVFLTVAMIFSLPAVTFAAANTTEYDESNAILLSKTLNIMVGDTNGNMNLDNFVSRAEFTKIAVAMSQYRNMVPPTSTTSFFRDCSFKHWAAPYVRLAVTNGLITGYPDGTFCPDNTVLLEEAVTVMLKLLGYTSEDFGSSWPYGQIGIATNEHVLDNITTQVGDELKRRDVLKLIYNTLVAKPKSASDVNAKYLQSLNCNIYEDAILIATNTENDSVTPGYVLTSDGTFKIGSDFDHGLIGRKGDLIVINGNDYAAFMQSVQTVQKHVVYSMLDNSVITYSNGAMSSFEADNNIAVYQDTNKTTFGAIRSSLSSGDTVYLMKNAAGNVDYMTVTTDNMAGPYTVSGSSQLSQLGIDAGSATVMRDGVRADSSAIQANDIVYYLADINTVFAYSRKITGVYEKATPNKDMPTSVTVSGTAYTIETAAAFDKLSSNGSCKIGDTITLLMGKDGQIADVITSTAGTSEELVGYLIGTGTKEFTNSDDESYTAIYATLIQPDGSELEVITDKNYSSFINRIMTASFENGVATLTAYKKGSEKLSGLVSAKNMKLGSTAVDENAQILDVTTTSDNDPGSYARVYLQRLDGISLSDSKILYANKNTSGKIDKLILLDATGDAYSYGVITEVKTSKTKVGEDEYDVTGRSYSINVAGSQYSTSTNYGSAFSTGSPVALTLSGNSINTMKKLNSSGTVKKIGEGTVTVGSSTYLTADNLVAYKSNLSSGISTYTIIPISELKGNEDNYTITAYSDKNSNSGGRVRLLIVKEK